MTTEGVGYKYEKYYKIIFSCSAYVGNPDIRSDE